MNKIILLLTLCLTLAFVSSSDAQRGIGGGFGKLGVRDKAKGGSGATNFLLVNTSVVLLADTGVKIKVQ